MGVLFTIVLLACVAANVVWSVFVRKLAKTRIVSICTIASVLLAFFGTLLAKTYVTDPAFFEGTLLPILAQSLSEDILGMFDYSITLRETIIGLPVALIAPLVFVILFLVLKLITGIVLFLISIFAGRAMRKSSKRAPYANARTIAWSAAAGLISLTVILIPVAFYGGIAANVLESSVSTDLMQAEGEEENPIDGIADAYITPITDSAIVECFRAMGGDAMMGELTSFNLNGEAILVSEEIEGILNLVNSITPLMDADFENMSNEDADKITGIADALAESKFLTTVMADVVYFLTDDMVNSDEPIIEDESGLFGGLLEKAIQILHDDAKDTKKFTADIATIAEMLSELIKGGVFSTSGEEDEALFDKLAGGDAIKNVIAALGKNDSMKCLIPEVTNIGIKAIASAIEVKADAGEAYEDLMNTIAADLNGVDPYDSDAVTTIASKLNSAFDHAGIVIDKQVLNLYAVAMIDELVLQGEGEVTALDVHEFFVSYAWSVEQLEGDAVVLAENANNDSNAVVLAEMVVALSALDAKSETYKEDVAAILKAGAFQMLGTNEGNLYNAVVGTEIKKNIKADTVANTAAMQNEEEFAKATLLIFLDELVVDVDEAAKQINKDNVDQEATAIGGVFSNASRLVSDVSGDSIGTMAESVGDVLNSLQNSVSVGKERTSKLFIAIIQSGMVRDAANMDITTATDLGNKGSGGDYAKTFKTISNTMDVLTNVNSAEGMSQEDLSAMLQDMTPETAGMIGSYITEERLNEEWGLGEQESATAAPIISDVFSYMGEADMTEEESQKEAAALNDVMNLANSATANAEEGTKQTVFGGEDSVMGKSANDTVETFMSSESVKHSLNNNAESLEDDAFGMQESMAEEEKEDLKSAMKNYYETTEYETEEDKEADKEALTNLGKLFGFSNEEIGNLFSEEPVNP